MIFISVGHHEAKPGASFNGFNEYDEASIWAEEIHKHIHEDSILVPHGVLKTKVNFINNRDPSQGVALEVHFNSAKNSEGEPIGRGCETLYYPNSSNGKLLAQLVNDALAQSFEPDRGIKEGYYRLDPRNSPDYFLARTHCPAIIIEPDFIHRKELIQANRDQACIDIAAALLVAQSAIFNQEVVS